jgi:hypothetical protein
MRERIADVLKLTPRRNQVSTAPTSSAAAQEAEKVGSEGEHDARGPESSTQDMKDSELDTRDAEAAAPEHREPDDQEAEDQETTRRLLSRLEITADVDLADLLPEENADGLHFAPEAADAPSAPESPEPPPVLRAVGRRGRRSHSPESDL